VAKRKGFPRHPSPIRAKLLELLDDEEWHDYERVMAQCMRMVPPGQAYRKAEESRVGYLQRHNREVKPRVRNTDSDQVIRSGARQVVSQLIQGQPEFEVDPRGVVPRNGPRKKIRLVKSRLPYHGWRKPEDVSDRVREIVGLMVEGYASKDIAAKLGIQDGTVRRNVTTASENIGLTTSIPHVVINRMWELGLIPRMGPMTETDRRYIRDVREYPGRDRSGRLSRLGISRDEFDRMRRRLLLRFKMQHFQDLESAIVEGRVNE
jgi:hypothetical protein